LAQVSPGHRRDFLLDSGAITAFAASHQLAGQYLDWIDRDFTGSLLIPVPVLTEVRTGDPRYDVPVDRLIKTLRGAREDVYVQLTVPIAIRAGTLRTRALESAKREISVTDAHVVAMADDLADHSAVTILTGDPDDMKLLVGVTRRTNIAVDVPG
jgi:hypothetical protein